MKPKQQTIIPPEGGWKENTFYIVECSVHESNPIWPAIFYTGFLSRGNPAGYNEILTTGDYTDLSDVVYLKAIKEITSDSEMRFLCENRNKSISEVIKA